MTSAEQIFSALLTRYGANADHWPFLYRVLLPLFLRLDACAAQWREAQAEERAIRALYKTDLPELTPSTALRARLVAIAQLPSKTAREPYIPVWRLSFAAAMASALLGVVLGAGGYFADYADPDDYVFETTASYEVSDWIAGTGL
ncbi:hypothetical protein [uncultured Zhongshania sp.]|uniref:hypothetical protein n=1 Tax=uncultured Zhongshania sp. TaxID=1642288 RepID=UPI0030D85E05|tara:strand:- start:522 stop:956 length:435 start_codon:yes stop_codon:yes gene_type:complete